MKNITTLSVIQLLTGMNRYIQDNTEFYDFKIGEILEVNEVKDRDIKNPILRYISIVVKPQKGEYLESAKDFEANADIKKLVFINRAGVGRLEYQMIDPKISVANELFIIEGKIEGDWKNLKSKFEGNKLHKVDVDKYFEVKQNARIARALGQETGRTDLFEIALGIKKSKEIIKQDIDSKFIEALDDSKKTAFSSAASDNDFMLIKGPPGTGKTTTIISLIKHFTLEKKRKVILASKTHAALDNVVERLSSVVDSKVYSGLVIEKSGYQGGVGNKANADKEMIMAKNLFNKIQSSSISNDLKSKLKKDYNYKVSPQRYFGKLASDVQPSVFLTTITSEALEKNIERKNYKFGDSILIMDETSKSTIADVLRYILYCNKVILVGDDMQLPPIPKDDLFYENFLKSLSENQLDIWHTLFEKSVFNTLFDKSKHEVLNTTYRSPNYILNLYNNLAYEGKIITKAPGVEVKLGNSLFSQQFINIYNSSPLLIIDDPKAFHEEENGFRSKVNSKEIDNIINHIKFLSKNLIDKDQKTLMVQFMYVSQLRKFVRSNDKFLSKMKEQFKDISFGTVDQLQGKEADIVLIATTYAHPHRKLPTNRKFKVQLQDMRRLNVLLSRSKNKITIFMNKSKYNDANIYKDEYVLKKGLNYILNKFQTIGVDYE